MTITQTCAWPGCGRTFEAADARYCSPTCRARASKERNRAEARRAGTRPPHLRPSAPIAEGNPGRLATFAALLERPCFWRDGRVFAHSLASEALIMALHSFRERNAPMTDKPPGARRGRGGRDD